MAHAAKINELVDRLIRSTVSGGQDNESLKHLRGRAVKTLRSATHSRTNQFEVKSKLNGLVEKFSVLNRDDLAEALQSRLEELPGESKWMPEILSLFLHLSDRPLERTRPKEVELLAKPHGDTEAPLTWSDVLADSTFNEPGIWDDVERGYHSSGDETTAHGEGDSDDTTSTSATSIEPDNIFALANAHVLQPDDSTLDEVRSAWARAATSSSLSELSVIREALLMLHGLPTNLYTSNHDVGAVAVNKAITLETASHAILDDLLSHLAAIGTALNALRYWVRSEQPIAYIQSCQAYTSDRFMDFSSALARVEDQYASPAKTTVVSIIHIRTEIEKCSMPLLHLSRLVDSIKQTTQLSPFALLDALYNETCNVDRSENDMLFELLVGVFLAGASTYLKPVSNWIQAGAAHTNDETFLVMEANTKCELSNFWHDRFALRSLSDGDLCAPKFMHGIARSVFAIGKAQAFLAALRSGDQTETVDADHSNQSGTWTADIFESSPLSPFSQTFNDELESWALRTSHDCTFLLREKMLEDYGLRKLINGLDQAFCSQDGTRFQIFAETLFWRFDHERARWRNSFLLSELAQSTLGSARDIEAGSLSIRVVSDSQSHIPTSSTRQFETIFLDCALPWPVQNITRSPSPAVHSRTFTFLLQVFRAKYVLRWQLFDLRLLDARTAHSSKPIRLALRLRYCLSAVVDALQDHITCSASLFGKSTSTSLGAAEGIDHMAAIWAGREKQLALNLLLAPNLKPIREAITRLLDLCERFAEMWKLLVINYTSTKLSEERSSGHPARVQTDVSDLHEELEKSLSFIVAGVASISRADGSAPLETLAERLQWSVH